ncbi:MAG: hypothetical protein ABSC23_18345 [Bryobacteraceae bacterium]|jgi:hypothetical protein
MSVEGIAMTKKVVLAGMVLLVVALVALAADAVTGKWVYQQPGRGGGDPVQVTLDLKADGANLTGSVLMPAFGGGAPAPIAISNGKADGNNISFDVVREYNGNSMKSSYKGVVSGSDMKLSVTRMGRDGTPTTTDFAAKKSTT